jgi:membrane-bound lytic murein transglycosylase F
MLWRWRWSYPVVVAILFVGSPAEPLDMVETARWEASDRRDNGTVRVAFVPDAGCLQIENGKQIGYEFALLEAWEDAIPQRIEWLFARSAEEALAWVQLGRADVAAGNIPLLERVGFTTSAPVRTFEWVQWGASDSLRWLAEYPKLPEFLSQSDSLPLAIGSNTMWRHLDPTQNGWILPDLYLPGLKNYPNEVIAHFPGSFHWAARSKDSLLVTSMNDFLRSKRAARIKGFYSKTAYVNDWLEPIALSPYDAIFAKNDWMDPYTLTALAYVESRFRSDIVSPAGAVGVMQLIPNTARRLGIDSLNLYRPESNIKAGIKYLRFLDQFWKQRGVPAESRLPFVLASYNTGPTPVARAADLAEKKGFDPTFWTGHVDQVAKGPGAHYARKTLKLAKIYRGYTEAIRRAKPIPAEAVLLAGVRTGSR